MVLIYINRINFNKENWGGNFFPKISKINLAKRYFFLYKKKGLLRKESVLERKHEVF